MCSSSKMGPLASQLWITFDLVLFSVLFSVIGCAPTVGYRFDDWRPFTWEPFTWKPVTWQPIDWNRFTFSPNDYGGNTSSSKQDVGLFFLIVVPGIVVYIVIIICKQYCKDSSSSTYVASYTTVHAPPRNSTNATRSGTEPVGVHRPPSSNRREGTQLSFTNAMTDFSSNSNRSNFGQNSNNIPRNGSSMPTSDRPPDYANVVHSDLWEPEPTFPTVNPKPVETPPPIYGEEKVPKFV